MELRFTPNEDDVRDLSRVRKASGWQTFLFVLLLVLSFAIAVHLIESDFATAGWIWLVLSFALGIAMYEVPRFQARRAVHRNPFAQGEIIFTVDDNGVTARFPTATAHLKWPAFLKYQETTNFFLLFFYPAQYWWIPKRVMSAEEAGDLRQALKAHIAPRSPTGNQGTAQPI